MSTNTTNKNFQKAQFVFKGALVLMDAAWEANQRTNKTYVADYAHVGRYLDDTLYGNDSCMIKYNISETGVD